MTDAAIRCEMFCTEPIGPDGDPGGEENKACCSTCEEKLKFVCGEVLPSIRKHGYYVPPGASPEQELAAMTDQADLGSSAVSLLDSLLGEGASAAMGWRAATGDTPGGES